MWDKRGWAAVIVVALLGAWPVRLSSQPSQQVPSCQEMGATEGFSQRQISLVERDCTSKIIASRKVAAERPLLLPIFLIQRARIAGMRNDWNKGLTDVNEAINVAGDPGLKACAYALRAMIYVALENRQQAKADIAKAEQLGSQPSFDVDDVRQLTKTFIATARKVMADVPPLVPNTPRQDAPRQDRSPQDVAYAKKCLATCKAEREQCMSGIAMDFTRSLSESTRNCDNKLHSCRMYCPYYGLE